MATTIYYVTLARTTYAEVPIVAESEDRARELALTYAEDYTRPGSRTDEDAVYSIVSVQKGEVGATNN